MTADADAGTTTRARPSRVHLSTLADVRREVASLYRAAKGGMVETADAARLGSLLALLVRVLEVERVEHRLGELEAALAERSGGDPFDAYSDGVLREARDLH